MYQYVFKKIIVVKCISMYRFSQNHFPKVEKKLKNALYAVSTEPFGQTEK